MADSIRKQQAAIKQHQETVLNQAVKARMAQQDERTQAFKQTLKDVGGDYKDIAMFFVPQDVSDVALTAATLPASVPIKLAGGMRKLITKYGGADNVREKITGLRAALAGAGGVAYTPETEAAALKELLRAGADTMKSAALAQPASKQEFLKLAGKTHTDLARALERKAKDPRYSLLMRDLLEKYEVLDPQKAKEAYDSGRVFVGSRGVTFGDIDARSAKNTTPGIHFAPAGQERQVADIMVYKQPIDAGKPGYDPKVGLVAARIKNPILVSDREAEFPAELATKLELVPEFREMVASGLPESEAITVLARRNGVGPLIYGNKIEGVKGRVNPSISIIDPDDIQKFSAGGLSRIAKKYFKVDEKPEKLQGTQIIKEPGGNWLSGSVEDALQGLKPLHARYGNPFSQDQVGFLAANPDKAALNSWIDKQLARYVKNKMATPEDPIRALAERGVLHFEPQAGFNSRLIGKRIEAGFPGMGVGKSPLAQSWEGLADSVPAQASYLNHLPTHSIGNGSVKAALENQFGKFAAENPESLAYAFNRGKATRDLGFDHLIDELSNAINPESGLPRNLLLDPKSLERVSVPQAVERVAAINAWRAAQKAEADALKANNAATVLHKEYPENNPLGLRWVELKAPQVTADTLPEGYELRTLKNNQGGEYFSLRDMNDRGLEIGSGHTPEAAIKSAGDRLDSSKELQDALKYEGDTMGHCVGGYCDDVLSGRSRIYSLRDTKGQPHVTIEVAPRDVDSTGLNEAQLQMVRRHGKSVADEIIQIKGKANRAPNEEYLPFVQDFVRSGKWSDVGDLQNTGLIDTRGLGRGFSFGVPQADYQRLIEAGLKDKAGVLEGEARYDTLENIIDRLNAPKLAKGGVVEAEPDLVEEFLRRVHLRGEAGSFKDEYAEGVAGGGNVSYDVTPGLNIGADFSAYRVRTPEGVFSDKVVDALKGEYKFAKGGVVEYNPTHIDSLANQLMEEVYGQ